MTLRIKKVSGPWLALFLLASTTCEPGLRTGEQGDPENMGDPMDRCAAGKDSDFDGVANDVECMLGLNPYKADSDMDGISDGDELKYPKICVATDMKMERRPPVGCKDDKGCLAGERCKGLDPTKKDSDGDGVADGEEVSSYGGMVDVAKGETDPRLWDTDGDGISDGMGGLGICRPSGLANVNIVTVPMGTIQVGHDLAWGMPRSVTGTSGRGALILDDPMTGVAGAVFTRAAAGADERADAMQAESTLVTALTATGVLTGRALTTHDMNKAVISTYRVARNTTASALRDALVNPFTGAAAPGGAAVGAASEFLVDITTVRRGSRNDIIVTVSPRADYENVAKLTFIRGSDLVNTTGVAQAGKTLGSGCQVFRAERSSIADFIWNVDTSGSMSDDQARLGNTATKFFKRLSSAGVDFRVGVITAGSQPPNLDNPGFRFISGTDPMGPMLLCKTVTYLNCPDPMAGADNLQPYPMGGGTEEPVASAILLHYALKRRGMMGEMNPDRKFRDGAKVVAFLVTDEPGSNDFSRYFMNASDPETNMRWGAIYNAATLANIIQYFKRNQILTFGLVPVSATPCANAAVADLPRCVIEGNGGATINITTALDAEVNAAMDKIVDAVAGATSQFKLDRSPITSTIKVRVKGKDVPRSRSDGFDYDPASRSIIFYGNTYRPQKGDEVVVSYRVWEGSLG